MIDPKLLTKEAGFEDGAVVELVTENSSTVFYFSTPFEGDRSIFISESNRYVDFDRIISLRPLSGDMAIWNFATNNTHLALVKNGDEIEQLCWWRPDTVDFNEWKQVWNDFGAVITERPWWSK